MSKAKRNALAVLFAAVALFMFAALLCRGFPMEAKAESGEAAYGASVNTFTAEMPEGYLANNVSDAAAADGSSAEETVVANITRGGQTLEFFTVQAAIGAAQDGETIKIPASSVITENIEVGSDQNIEISINADVQFSGALLNEGTIAIEISGGSLGKKIPSEFNAEITNSGSLSIEIKRYSSAGAYYYAELNGPVSNSGTLTLTGTGNCNAQITNATGGVLTVKNNLNVNGAITNSGTFTIANGTYNGDIVNNGGTIAIQGGNFTQEQKEAFGDYLAEGYRWTLSSTAGNFSAIAEESVVYTLTRGGAGYGFASLSAALTAANEGETIVLEKPYSINSPNSTQKLNKSVTVDLNGKKISTQSRFEATTAGTDITVKNGSIVYTGNGSNATYVGFRVSGGASLTLDGVSVDWSSIDSGRAAEVGVSNTSAAGTLILKNGSVLKGGEVGVFLAGTKDADTKNKTALYAEDSIIESVAAASAGVMTNGSTYNTVIELVNTDVSGTLAIYQPSKNGTLTIDGGTMRGNTGIEIRNGTLTVKGGAEIVATGEYKVSETPSSSGSTVSGAALAVTKYENDGTLAVNIEGGTFRAESENGVAFCERNPEADDGTHSPENVPIVSITGGIFEGSVSAVNVQKFIEGGTFTAEGDISAYLADGFTTNEDGTVVPDAQPNAVAKVKLADGTEYYERLADAFLAAKDGATIDILQDVTQEQESDLYAGYSKGEGGVWLYIRDKSLTINGNGYTLTCTTAAWAMYIINDDKTGQIETLTINDLTIVVTTPKVQSNEAGVTSCAGIVLWHGETKLVLNNVTVNTEACGVENATALSVAGNGANTTIAIQGGAFKAAQDTGYAFMANNPVRFTAEDTEFSGWSAIYLRCGKVTSGSAALGTSGSVVTLTNTKLYGYGQYPGETNKFGVIVLNDGGITVNVIGGSVNLAPAEGAMMQSVVYYSTFSGADPSTSKVTFTDTDVTLTGSNTVFVWGNFNQNAGGDVTVAGGTFNFAVTENYLAEGYAPLLQADGTYAVVDREDAVAAGQAVAALTTTDIYGREVQVLYSTLQAAVNAAKEGDTVTLLANVNESIVIAEGQEIVLDLNGKTLTNAAGSHTVTNYGTLTIVGNGTVDNKDNGRAAVFNAQGGTAYLNSGTYTRSAEASTDFDSANGNSYYVIINQGTMTIGTETTSPTVCFPEGRGYHSSLVENGWFTASQNTAKVNAVLTIDNGTFTGGKHSFKNDSYGELVINNATVSGAGSNAILNWNILTVNDGSFTGDIGAVLTAGSGADYESGNTKIYGGEFTGVLAIDSSYNVAEYSVSGGTFSEAVPAEYLAAECAQMSAEGAFTVGTTESLVTEKKAVAVNAETAVAYTSLQDAIDAAGAKETVKLLCNVTADAEIKVAQGQDIFLDLNGFTLSSTVNKTLVNEGKLAVVSTGEQGTIIGNTSAIYNGGEGDENVPGQLSGATLSLNNVKLQSTNTNKSAGVALNNGPATIESIVNCVITAADGTNAIRNSGVIKSVSDTTITVGDASGLFASKGTAFDLCGNFAGSGVVESVTGSIITGNIKIATDAAGKTGSIAMNEGNTFDGEIDCGEGFYVLETENGYAAGDQTFVTEEYNAVAVNAETAVAYTSLQEAVNAADAGETVTLLANVNESIEIAQGQEIVLDLNGKTLTNAAGSHTVTNYGTLTIVGNGTVTNTTDEKAAVFNEGTAYLNGGTYTRTADGTWYVIANNGAMEMRGITVRNENVNDPSSLVQNNLDASKDDPATLTIYSGNYACAGGNVIMNNDYGVLTIEDGTFVAHNYTDKENYQVVQNYATATINGGTFTADAVAIAASAYDGQSSSTTINGGTFTAGSHGSAAALYFFDYDGNSSVNVTITGGEFNGTYAIRTYKDSTADDTMSIQGGTFEGDIAMGDMTGFISGGRFKQQPAAEYMDPGYIAEYRDGFYVPVESSALYIAQKEARADIRMYAASLGIAWSDVVAAADPENASPYKAEAELVMNAYNAIAAAASEKQVADARLAAMDVVEIYAAFVVEAEELEAAKTNAEADVRAYAANYGILWAELEGMAEAETLVGWSAQAVLSAYAKIAAAASEKQVADAKLEAMGALDVLYDAVKGDAMTDIAAWLNEYLDEILGTAGDAGSGVAVVRAFTAETTAGDIYAKLAQAFSEDNAKLVLKYYNDALAAIDAATTVSEVTTAVSTFKAQVASVEAAAQNVTDVDLTGVYVLLAILVVAVAVVIVVMILKRRQQPAQQAAVQEAAPVQAQAAPEPVTREVAVTDDDKEQVVIAANVRSFSEAYVDLSQELRELFNKVRAYALGKENAVEVRQSTGVCVKRNGKQIVKLTVRRNAPVALFFLENEMLKDFRRESGSQSKLKVHATELILREEADLAAAYKMVDLSIEQIDKDIAAKKERAKELRRLRRQQKAEQSKKNGAES